MEEGRREEKNFSRTHPLPKMRNTGKVILTFLLEFLEVLSKWKSTCYSTTVIFYFNLKTNTQTKTQIFQLYKKIWAPNNEHFNQWLLPGYKRLGTGCDLKGIRHPPLDTQQKWLFISLRMYQLMREFFVMLLQFPFRFLSEIWNFTCEMWDWEKEQTNQHNQGEEHDFTVLILACLSTVGALGVAASSPPFPAQTEAILVSMTKQLCGLRQVTWPLCIIWGMKISRVSTSA